jgi:ubiquinone/menaquinone biosynthesis C-methylase UbiE
MHLSNKGEDFPSVDEELLKCLSPCEKEFFLEQVSRPLEYYIKRLKMIGFEGYKRVLDAGCGVGQWSLALTKLNAFVVGVDISMTRLLIALELKRKAGAQNLSLRYAFLESLPYEDEFFDAIFCYGTFWLTFVPKTLKEFLRLLKPGGRVYINVDDWGWYLHLIVDRGIKGKEYPMLKSALKVFINTILRRKKLVAISEKGLRKMLMRRGFKIISSGAEGSINVTGIDAVAPIYEASYYKLPSVVEVLAEK